MASPTSNPFIYGRPVRPDEFLNRQDELKPIFNRLNNGESTAVVGGPHIGKSSLLLKLADERTQMAYLGDDAQRLVASLLDLQSISSDFAPANFWEEALEPLRKHPDDSARQLLEQVASAKYSRDSLLRLFEYLGNRRQRLLLLLDQFDRLLVHPGFQDLSFFAILRSLATKTNGLALVIASRLSLAEMNERGRGLLETGSPLFNFMIEIRLRPFDEQTVHMLLDQAGDTFCSDDRRFIRRVAGRHPFLLQAMAATLMETTGDDRQARAAERFYEQASSHFDDLWDRLDDRTRTAAVILSLVELGGRALGQDFSYGEIENVDDFGSELRKLAERGLAERVDDDWQFDYEHLMLWQGERWTVGTQAFAWWIHDIVIAETRQVSAYDDWLANKRYRSLLTQEQWDRLTITVRNVPEGVTRGVSALARALFDELVKKEPQEEPTRSEQPARLDDAAEEETPKVPDTPQVRDTSPDVPSLLEDLSDRARNVRRKAVQALGEVSDLQDTSPLILALADRSSRMVRPAAAEALVKLWRANNLDPLPVGPSADLAAVLEAVTGTSNAIAQAAALVALAPHLTELQLRRALTIAQEVDDEEWRTRAVAALEEHLPRIGEDEEVATISDLAHGKDQLGFANYATAFRRLIEDGERPLTIGVYGAWGTGKTFLMDMVARDLGYDPDRKPSFWENILGPLVAVILPIVRWFLDEDDEVRDDSELTLWQRFIRPLQTKALVVWFEAWDYNGCDKLWAGLVERVFRSIEESRLGWYGQIRLNLPRNLEYHWRTLRTRLLPYTLISVIASMAILGLLLIDQAIWATVIGSSTGLVVLARELYGILFTPASKRIIELFSTPNYEDDLGFMGRIRQDLEGFVNSLPPDFKVVIFIDDLDRCHPEKAVEVLEAVKLLLEFEAFIVFIGLDARIITQAVEEHYGKVLKEAQITGYEYLDKIVQIPFSIPEPSPKELSDYVKSLVGSAGEREEDEQQIASQIERPAPVPDDRGNVAVTLDETSDNQVPGRVPDDNGPTEGLDEDGPGTVSDEGPDSDETNEILDDSASVQTPDVGPSDDGLTPIGPTEQPGDQGEGGTEEQIVRDSERQTGEQPDGGFNEPEQKAFESLCSHLDPNPRRVKRLVNVYRLVRALINQRRVEAREGSDTALELPQSPYQILAWLILCEQWPYAAHVILDTLNRDSGLHMSDTVKTLYEKARPNIDDRDLQKLDLNYDRLKSFVDAHLVHLRLGDVQRLRPFTVNFNPALSAEVRLTLQSGEHSSDKPEKGK